MSLGAVVDVFLRFSIGIGHWRRVIISVGRYVRVLQVLNCELGNCSRVKRGFEVEIPERESTMQSRGVDLCHHDPRCERFGSLTTKDLGAFCYDCCVPVLQVHYPTPSVKRFVFAESP
jgi:hypothetical protein